MDSEVKQVLDGLLMQLIGKLSWGVAIGPVGVHVHFGEVHKDSLPGGKPHGDFSIWVKGAIKINNNKREIIYQATFPPESDHVRLSGLVSEKTISEAAVDYTGNILRLVLNNDILFSAFPVSNGNENYPWILYDHLREKPLYVVVHKGKCEVRIDE